MYEHILPQFRYEDIRINTLGLEIASWMAYDLEPLAMPGSQTYVMNADFAE